MRIKFIKWHQKLLLLALSTLGITTGCGDNPFITPGCEYGTPYAKFKISGRVTDSKTGTGIENIGIISSKIYKPDTIEYREIWDTIYANQYGDYYTELNLFPVSDTVYLTFYDKDSISNDFYLRKDTSVYFNRENLTGGDDNWYEGETSVEFNVKLDKNSTK